MTMAPSAPGASPPPSPSDPSPVEGEGRNTALRAMRIEPRFPRTTLTVTAGLLIWATDFLFIYVFAALACARGFAHTTVLGFDIVPFMSTLATAAAAASIALIVAGARRAVVARAASVEDTPASAFLGRLAMIVAMLALIAIALTGLPGLLVRGSCE